VAFVIIAFLVGHASGAVCVAEVELWDHFFVRGLYKSHGVNDDICNLCQAVQNEYKNEFFSLESTASDSLGYTLDSLDELAKDHKESNPIAFEFFKHLAQRMRTIGTSKPIDSMEWLGNHFYPVLILDDTDGRDILDTVMDHLEGKGEFDRVEVAQELIENVPLLAEPVLMHHFHYETELYFWWFFQRNLPAVPNSLENGSAKETLTLMPNPCARIEKMCNKDKKSFYICPKFKPESCRLMFNGLVTDTLVHQNDKFGRQLYATLEDGACQANDFPCCEGLTPNACNAADTHLRGLKEAGSDEEIEEFDLKQCNQLVKECDFIDLKNSRNTKRRKITRKRCQEIQDIKEPQSQVFQALSRLTNNVMSLSISKQHRHSEDSESE